MTKETIIKKWAEDTNNKYALNEDMVKMGIERMSPIISNQLNSVANRADTFIDLLQRCSAWNVNKTYQIGDMAMVSVYYKRASDTNHKYYIMFLLSTKADNKEIPLVNAGPVSFTRNDNLSVPCFTITANVDTLMLSQFVGSGWAFCDSTCGDLTNCMNLSVSDAATFKGNTSFEGVVDALSDLNISGNANINGNTTITGESVFNGNVTLNGDLNTAITPDITANGNEVITAEWARQFLGKQNKFKEDIIRNNIIQSVSFKADEQNKIIIGVPLEFIFQATSFGFKIELENNTTYLSKVGFDLGKWLKHSNYNETLTSESFLEMYYPLSYASYSIVELDYTGQMSYIGTSNNLVTKDFNYKVRIGTRSQILNDSTVYPEGSVEMRYIEISTFTPSEDLNGEITMIIY